VLLTLLSGVVLLQGVVPYPSAVAEAPPMSGRLPPSALVRKALIRSTGGGQNQRA